MLKHFIITVQNWRMVDYGDNFSQMCSSIISLNRLKIERNLRKIHNKKIGLNGEETKVHYIRAEI